MRTPMSESEIFLQEIVLESWKCREFCFCDLCCLRAALSRPSDDGDCKNGAEAP